MVNFKFSYFFCINIFYYWSIIINYIINLKVFKFYLENEYLLIFIVVLGVVIKYA